MTDIFREVEEDVRRERVEKIWKRFGNYIIAAIVLVFVGIGGWQLWERHDKAERDKLASQLAAAQRITTPRDAANAFHDMADAKGGYGKLAKLAQANAMLTAGQRDEAVALYKDIAANDSGVIGSTARLRAAWGLADNATRSQLNDLLQPLMTPGNPWRQNAQEVLAYADYRALDTKSALTKYTALSLDPEAPDNLRSRAKAMTAFLKGGGAVTYGSVPPDVITPPPGGPNAPVPAPAVQP